MVIQSFHPIVGGAQSQVLALAPHLATRGIDVDIVTRRWPGLGPTDAVDGLPVVRTPMPPTKAMAAASFIAGTARFVGRHRPDVLHAFELLSPTAAALVAKSATGAPVVAKVLRGGSLGDLAVLRNRPFGRVRLAWYRREVDRFVVISREIDDELADAGIEEQRRAFIPNGVDVDRFAPVSRPQRQELRWALGLPRGPVALYVGRLAEEKRLDVLVREWTRLRAELPDSQLVVVGDGPEEDRLRRLPPGLVRLVGRTDDVVPWLRAADVFVLPSVAEGLSNALLEALAVGLPVVATDVGGARDVITDGVDGVLVPATDGAALGRALRRVLSQPAWAREMGDNGRANVARHHRLEVVADDLAALYAHLADRADSAGGRR